MNCMYSVNRLVAKIPSQDKIFIYVADLKFQICKTLCVLRATANNKTGLETPYTLVWYKACKCYTLSFHHHYVIILSFYHFIIIIKLFFYHWLLLCNFSARCFQNCFCCLSSCQKNIANLKIEKVEMALIGKLWFWNRCDRDT